MFCKENNKQHEYINITIPFQHNIEEKEELFLGIHLTPNYHGSTTTPVSAWSRYRDN